MPACDPHGEAAASERITPDERKARSFGWWIKVRQKCAVREGDLLEGDQGSCLTHAILRFRFNHCKESIGMDTLPAVMSKCFPQVPYTINKSDWFAQLPNKSEIWLGGLDDKERTEKILGKEYATLYLNEASQIPYNSRNLAVTRLAQRCIYRTDSGDRELALKMYYDCNPPGKGHWIYQMFYQHRDPETKQPLSQPENYVHMTMNPRDNAANLPADYIKELENLPARTRRRFLDGLYGEAAPGALWTEEMIESWRESSLPTWCAWWSL
jgi:hypothetical protein